MLSRPVPGPHPHNAGRLRRRRGRGRTRPAGRPAGRGGGDPRSGPPDCRARRLEETQRGEARGAVPADHRARAGVLHRADRAGRDRPAEHLPGHHGRHESRRGRPRTRRAGSADRRQQTAEGPALSRPRDRRRRRAGAGDQRRLDPGQGQPRPPDGGAGRDPSRLRLRRCTKAIRPPRTWLHCSGSVRARSIAAASRRCGCCWIRRSCSDEA